MRAPLAREASPATGGRSTLTPALTPVVTPVVTRALTPVLTSVLTPVVTSALTPVRGWGQALDRV